MPNLMSVVLPSLNEAEKEKTLKFWNNVYAYAEQAAPYGTERVEMLNKMGAEITQMLGLVPPEISTKISQKLKTVLVDPIESDTAQEYDTALARLQAITKELHTKLTPSMSQMQPMGMQGMQGMKPPMTGTAGPINQGAAY